MRMSTKDILVKQTNDILFLVPEQNLCTSITLKKKLYFRNKISEEY